MIKSANRDRFIGKVIQGVEAGGLSETDLVMVREITITFTDGTKLVLRTDWRGNDCYISEYTE